MAAETDLKTQAEHQDVKFFLVFYCIFMLSFFIYEMQILLEAKNTFDSSTSHSLLRVSLKIDFSFCRQ